MHPLIREKGGADMAPHTPRRSKQPGEAVALLDTPEPPISPDAP